MLSLCTDANRANGAGDDDSTSAPSEVDDADGYGMHVKESGHLVLKVAPNAAEPVPAAACEPGGIVQPGIGGVLSW